MENSRSPRRRFQGAHMAESSRCARSCGRTTIWEGQGQGNRSPGDVEFGSIRRTPSNSFARIDTSPKRCDRLFSDIHTNTLCDIAVWDSCAAEREEIAVSPAEDAGARPGRDADTFDVTAYTLTRWIGVVWTLLGRAQECRRWTYD